MKEIILADRENCREIANQFKYSWFREVLSQTGMDLSECFSEDEEQSIEQKAKLRRVLNDNDIVVLDNNEEIKIYIQKEIIAEWNKPIYNLKQDISQINPKKKFYVNIEIDYWSVFDNLENNEKE
jgi:hypothetical protein